MEKCDKSPDKKHHYELSQWQHAITNHECYSCAFCGNEKCKNIFVDRSENTLLKLPTMV